MLDMHELEVPSVALLPFVVGSFQRIKLLQDGNLERPGALANVVFAATDCGLSSISAS